MHGSVFVGRVGDEPGQFLLFSLREERICCQKMIIVVLDIFELRRVDMCRMQLQAHPGKLGSELPYFLGFVGRSAGIGFLAQDALEADTIAPVFRDHEITRLRSGNAQIVDLVGHHQFIQRLLDLARIIEFEHHRRIALVVIAFPVGATAEQDIVVERDLDCFHLFSSINIFPEKTSGYRSRDRRHRPPAVGKG